MINKEFVERLNITFDHASMADVARRLNMPHATVRNYYQGRLPAPEVLIKIGNETGVSLNWLLIGTGDKYAGQVGPIGLGKFIEEKISEMIDQKLAGQSSGGSQNDGPADGGSVFEV
jgi:transcriptional regulator with XRE-family HTH domain